MTQQHKHPHTRYVLVRILIFDSLSLQCTASTAKMCVYGLLSFVITSFEEESLQVYTQILLIYSMLNVPYSHPHL